MAVDSWAFSRHFVFAMLLLAESVCDLEWRECPDVFHLLMLTLLAARPMNAGALALSLLQALPPGGIFLAASVLNPGKLGGADVKLAAVAGALLGWRCALWGLCTGIVIALARERKRPPGEGFALIPYLSLGLSFINIGRILL